MGLGRGWSSLAQMHSRPLATVEVCGIHTISHLGQRNLGNDRSKKLYARPTTTEQAILICRSS